MSSLRRIPLLVVLAVLLAATGVAATFVTPPTLHTAQRPVGVYQRRINCALLHRSLECVAGRISFFNTANAARKLSVSVVSDLGRTWTGTIELAAHAGQVVQPKVVDAPASHRSKSGRVTTVAVNYASPCRSAAAAWSQMRFRATRRCRASLKVSRVGTRGL